MELKLLCKRVNACFFKRSNRTFMELKLVVGDITASNDLVLIVPLWN